MNIERKPEPDPEPEAGKRLKKIFHHLCSHQ